MARWKHTQSYRIVYSFGRRARRRTRYLPCLSAFASVNADLHLTQTRTCIGMQIRTIFRKVVPSGRELLVSRRCAEAVLRGAHVYIPGMIGCSPHCAKGDAVTVLCDIHDRFLRGSSTHILSTRKLDPKRMKGCAIKKMGLDDLSVRNKKKPLDARNAEEGGGPWSSAGNSCVGGEEQAKRDAMRSQFRGDKVHCVHDSFELSV